MRDLAAYARGEVSRAELSERAAQRASAPYRKALKTLKHSLGPAAHTMTDALSTSWSILRWRRGRLLSRIKTAGSTSARGTCTESTRPEEASAEENSSEGTCPEGTEPAGEQNCRAGYFGAPAKGNEGKRRGRAEERAAEECAEEDRARGGS